MSTSYSGKWIRSFVCGCIAAACLVLAASTNGLAQVSVGIKAGVPFTGLLQPSSSIGWQGWGFGSQAQTPHYAIGPVVDIRLPGPYSLNVGAMYKGIWQQAPDVTLMEVHCVLPAGAPLNDCENEQATFQTQVVSKVGRSWEFPVAIQYHFSSPSSLRPYVEGGYSYNHLSGIFVNPAGSTYNPQLPLPQHVVGVNPSTINRSGFLLGGGVEIKLPLIRVTPGVRYARYDSSGSTAPPLPFIPFQAQQTPVESRNALDFVMGINLNSKSDKSRP